MKFLTVIPARMQSTRLPGKPLLNLMGKSMLERTYNRCLLAVPSDQLIIATDHLEIENHCKLMGMNVIMTSTECMTGTDRVAEVATKIDADIYINVQGDEPLMNPADIRATIRAAQKYPGEIINGYASIDEADYINSHTPKVVFSKDNSLLYMSRSSIPGNKKQSFTKAWRQVCVYAFPKVTLKTFAAQTEKTPLESIEDIELLRFIELGIPVRMIPLSTTSIPVDTPEDLDKVMIELKKLENV
ncbi:3-deoxy-manno-octulosonate cytidylyltransferase [Phaeodactylibacter xiamenensis]|uniref:3-deoxy-manno-octulosonate cytidylyltransferase n=1 Tax=Phaeodactylibacter xiamenensis TaxID=1524460 RepID=UPI003BAC8B6D